MRFDPRPLRNVFVSRCFDHRLIVVRVVIGRVVEKGQDLVVLALRERVVLVFVTAAAAERRAHPHLHRRVDPVHHGLDPELLVVGSALRVGHGVAMKARGDALGERRILQQIAGQLLDREPVKRQVTIERFDHPVAIPPDRAAGILLVAVRVGVPRQIQPQSGPSLAVVRAVEQPIHDPFVGMRVVIGQVRVHLFNRRRQTRQVQARAPNQRGSLRLR